MESRSTRNANRRRAAFAAALLVLGILACGVLGCGGSKTAPLHVGAPLTVDKPVAIAALAQAPESFAGQTVRVEGTVKAVCQGMGCWVEVQDAKGASFIARSLDESVLLPKDCVGRKVAVQGVVTALPQEKRDEPAEAGHACPKPEYVVATSGVTLR